MIKPTVSVVIITYAHENFIEEAIKGVLNQECDFEVELIIANDCSPDKTDDVIQNVIKTYKNSTWIKYIKHKKNIGMMPNFIFALREAQGKYIALCEGDDYWTNPLKLQKQVDFLESNQSYMLVCSNVNIINDVGVIIRSRFNFKDDFDINIDYLLHKNHITTCTVLFRNNCLVLENLPKLNFLDKFIWMSLLIKGKCRYINENLAAYRIHNNGIYSGLKQYSKSISRIEDYKTIIKLMPNLEVQIVKHIYKNAVIGILSSIKNLKFTSAYEIIKLIK